MIFSNVNFKSLINLDFFSSNIVVSVEVAFVSVRTKKWGESRGRSRGGGERGRIDGAEETGMAMMRAFISGKQA